MPNALGQTRLLTQLHRVSLRAVSPRMRSQVLDARHTSTEVRPHQELILFILGKGRKSEMLYN